MTLAVSSQSVLTPAMQSSAEASAKTTIPIADSPHKYHIVCNPHIQWTLPLDIVSFIVIITLQKWPKPLPNNWCRFFVSFSLADAFFPVFLFLRGGLITDSSLDEALLTSFSTGKVYVPPAFFSTPLGLAADVSRGVGTLLAEDFSWWVLTRTIYDRFRSNNDKSFKQH